ncbi:hypothetical protein GQE99_18195 [Maritimibacter sp. DP07]|uniref:Uncharacterized protein n=1 Tax=Maritimibacter harenae TaxID=2606218 RepID=A0A845M5W7_9RHOB|nr:hypothetical protein [Maritimibacter harenae]MZR14956.1 hypothetical protein [Maritimibacter harenae]
MTQTILTLAVAYAFVVALALLVLLQSRFPLILRAGLTVMTVALIFLTYRGIGEIRGLPSDSAPPERFRLYWAQVDEPDKVSGDPGTIFLWIRELDEEHYPVGQPRAHKLPYSEELAALVMEAQREIAKGEDIAGEVEDAEDEDTAEELAQETQSETGGNSARIGQRVVDFDFGALEFGPAPAPVTPDKAE